MIGTSYTPARKNARTLRHKKMKQMWLLYLMLFFPVAHTILFHYVPLYGIQLAFKDFIPVKGISGSPWIGLKHIGILFSGATFPKVLWNTVRISLLRILVCFPAPIIFALLLNEVMNLGFKKTVQTISYLPHFMSWVVLAGIIKEVLSPTRGILNSIRGIFGGAAINYIAQPSMFVPILLLSSLWQGIGWGAIIYLASMSSIDPELYEAAEIDGANRWHKAIHVTLPGIVPIIIIQYILTMGGVLNAGFEQIFNLMNNSVLEVADIIDTYVYRIGLQDMKYDLSTAVGLFKNVVGATLIIVSNMVIRKFSEYGIW